ncbi:MAG: hypothetical protein AAF918_16095, partial [Pseudomonadota bacterium]
MDDMSWREFYLALSMVTLLVGSFAGHATRRAAVLLLLVWFGINLPETLIPIVLDRLSLRSQ